MLRELLDRLCRRGDFEPIGPDETPELPLALRPEAFDRWPGAPDPDVPEHLWPPSVMDSDEEPELPRTRRPEAFAPPTAIDLSGIETTYDQDDVRPWKPGEPRAELRGGWPLRDSLESESILRALARDAPVAYECWCVLCDSTAKPASESSGVEHDVTCPYLRAVEWVRANPA